MDLVDIEPDDPRAHDDVLPVLLELRTHLTAESFAAIYREGHEHGLRYLAAYEGGHCVAVAGWRFVVDTASGRKIYIDDLVTAADHRGLGAGRALVTELTERARAAGCSRIDLDSGTQRLDAHRFYMREGLTIRSFHFAKETAAATS
jgi:GNAT superfamily N-acetyltransferase